MSQITDIALNEAFLGWLALFGTIYAIGATFYGVYEKRKSRRAKEPCWSEQSYPLVVQSRVAVPDLEVSFQGRRVETVTISELLFWNNGRETINGADVASANPLRIKPHLEGTILAASVIASNSQSQPRLGLANNEAVISFDYLDQGQGIVYRVVHTGNRPRSLNLVGDIRGSEPLQEVGYFYGDLIQPARKEISRSDQIEHFARNNFVLLWLLIFPIAASILTIFDPKWLQFALITWFGGLIFVVGILVLSYLSRDKRPPQPTGFTLVEELGEELDESVRRAPRIRADRASNAKRRQEAPAD